MIWMFPNQFRFVEVIKEVVDYVYYVFFHPISPHMNLDM